MKPPEDPEHRQLWTTGVSPNATLLRFQIEEASPAAVEAQGCGSQEGGQEVHLPQYLILTLKLKAPGCTILHVLHSGVYIHFKC